MKFQNDFYQLLLRTMLNIKELNELVTMFNRDNMNLDCQNCYHLSDRR